MKRFALFFAALLCAPPAAVSAYAGDYGDISIKIQTVLMSLSANSYGEYRATIVNRSTTTAHRVTIKLEAALFGGAVQRTVEIAPSSTMTISMIAPGVAHNAVAGALIDGSRQRDVEIDLSRVNSWVSRSFNRYFLLISPEVDKSGLMNEAALVEGFKNAAGGNEVAHLAYQFPLAEWSANWVAYSGFDAVAITAEELRAAPAAVRSALWSFAECGGSLLILDSGRAGAAEEIPEQWRSRRIAASFEVEFLRAGFGELLTKSMGPKAAPPEKISVTLPAQTPSYFAGFGTVTILDAANVKNVLPAQWESIKYSWTRARQPGKTYSEITDINDDFPVIESEKIGIPVRGLFVLMLAFVIAIGPINLIWLSRKRRKIWLLWTAPAIALITCLAVTVFALFGEGVSAISRAETFTILDESSHRASTIGWTAFYAPITPGDGLHFSYDTELTPVRPTAWLYDNGERNKTIDLSSDQHLDSEWIMARVPVYFKFRKSETRRERLTIRREGSGGISVVNGLGADVRRLWLADRDGKVYSASGIGAGAEAKLSPADLKLAGNAAGARELFAGIDWLAKMREVDANPQNYLSPGSYLAELDASPFVEEGLNSVKTRKGRALIYGISAPAGDVEK